MAKLRQTDRLAAGRRFSPGTPVSSIPNKTDRNDITEILLNTINLTHYVIKFVSDL